MHNWLIYKDDRTNFNKYFVQVRIPDMFSLNVIYLLGGAAKAAMSVGVHSAPLRVLISLNRRVRAAWPKPTIVYNIRA
jgi:hypothetical protein